MILLLLFIVLLLFVYTKRNKISYFLLFMICIFSYVVIRINPNLTEKYNLKQILYLIDNFNFVLFIILGTIVITLLLFIIFDRTKKNRILYSFISILGVLLLFIYLLAINIFIVKEPLKNHFEGYVFDEIKKPLIGVKVIDGRSRNNYVLTDHKGFFKLERKQEIDNESNLVFIKKGYKDNSILIKVDSYHPHSSHFIFLRIESDTIYMEKQ
jgi:hypothetical protein